MADLPGNNGRVVVITGGSSGIGRCTAGLFARKGFKVGLIARGAAGLAAAAADVEDAGGRVATAVADVADSVALAAAAERLIAALGPIDIWVNCAGNGVYGRFADVPEAEFRRVTDVTYHGTVNGTRIALAGMMPRRTGTIVNVCSAMAFHGLALMSAYAGAKAAVRGFGQALLGELRLAGSPVRISTVFPPAANTPFFSHATSHMEWPARPAPPVYQPAVVAAGIYLAAMTGRPEVSISFTVAGFSWLSRLAPGLTRFLMARLGLDGQLTRDPLACRLHAPTLFAASELASAVHGPFGRRARGWSSHLWLARGWAAVIRGWPIVPWLARRAQPVPCPLPAGSAPRRAGS